VIVVSRFSHHHHGGAGVIKKSRSKKIAALIELQRDVFRARCEIVNENAPAMQTHERHAMNFLQKTYVNASMHKGVARVSPQ
jgi:hypothetical protein